MEKRTIKIREVVQDIKARMSDASLMENKPSLVRWGWSGFSGNSWFAN